MQIQLIRSMIGKVTAALSHWSQSILSWFVSPQSTMQLRLEQQFRLMADHAPVLIWVANTDAECVYFNRTWLNFTGRTLEQELGHGWAEGVHPDDVQQCMHTFLTAFQAREPFSIKYRLRQANGDYCWVLDHGIPQFQGRNQFIGYIGSCTDITVLKQAEAEQQQLLKQLSDLKFALDQSAIVATTDAQGRITYVNDRFCQVSQYTQEELIGQTHQLINSGHHPKFFFQDLWQTITSGQGWKGEIKNRAKDGSEYWVDTVIVPLVDKQDQPYQYMAIQFEITEHKRAEAALRQSEEQNRAILSAIPDLLTVLDATGQFLTFSANHFNGEVIPVANRVEANLHIHDVMPRDAADQNLHMIQLALRTGEMQLFEQKIQFGDIIQFEEVRVVPYQPNRVLCMVRNISDRKRLEAEREQAELALRESETRLRRLAENLPGVVYRYVQYADGSDAFPYISPRVAEIYGVEAEAVMQQASVLWEIIHPEDVSLVRLAIADALKHPEHIFYVEHRIITPTGQLKWVQATARYEQRDTEVVWDGVVLDITDRKQAELALQRSEEQLRLALEFGRIAIWDWDAAIGNLVWNTIAYEILGYQPGAIEPTYQDWLSVVHSEDRAAAHQEIELALATKRDFSIEYRVIWPDGTQHWIADSGRGIYNADGQVIRSVGVMLDITDRKLAEEALRQSEAQYRRIVETANEGIWIIDPDNKTSFVNSKMAEILGYSVEEMMGKSMFEFMEQTQVEIATRNAERRRQGIKEHHDFKFQHKNGADVWAMLAANPILDDSGQYIGALAMITDITARKQAEEALRHSQAQLAKAQAIAHVGSWEFDLTTQAITWSDEMFRIYGMDPAGPEPTYTQFRDRVHPDDWPTLEAAIEQAISHGIPYEVEHRIYRPDGTLRYLLGKGEVVTNAQDHPIQLMGTGQDITERKQVEDSLRQSEAKQSALIRALPDLIARVSDDGVYLEFCTSPTFRVLGDPEQLIGTHVEASLPPELAERRMNAIQAALQTGELQVYEQELWVDGVLQTEECRIVVCGDNELLIIGRDITNRKRAEQALQESEERRRLALELTNTGSWEFDVATGGAIWSDSHYRLMGLTPGERPSNYQTWRERVHPEELEWVETAFAQALRNQMLLDLEYRIVHPDGTVRWVLTKGQGIYDQTGQPLRMLGVMMDVSDRKQAELALQKLNEELEQRVQQRTQELIQSEQDLRTIFNNVYDAIFIHDLNGTILDVNDRALELYAATREQLLAASIADLSAPDAPLACLSQLFQQVQAGKLIQLEWKDRRLGDDSIFDAEVSLRLVTLDNRSVCIAGIRDITDRKLAELALQESEDRFRTLFEATPTPIQGYDKDRRVIFWNRASEELYGHTRAEAIGQPIEALIIPEPMQAEILPILDAWIAGQGEGLPNGELQLHNQYGELVEVYSSHLKLTNVLGEPEMYCINIDLRDRRLAEAALREAQQFAQSIADKTPATLYIYDLVNQSTRYSNRSLAESLGYTPTEIQAMGATLFPTLLHPEDAEAVAHHQQALTVAADGEDLEIEYRLRHASGEWRWFYSRDSVFKRNEAGHVTQYIGAAQNITERKQLEQELRQINAELEKRVTQRTLDLQQAMEAAEAANQAKTVFLANMSHELRTPLNAILGFSQLLNRDIRLHPDQQEQVSIINRSGEHLLNLINDILAISKIEAGRMTLSVTSFDLQALLGNLELLFRLKAESKGLALTIQTDASLPCLIQTDESKLRQVLINLLGNAIKFTSQGSVVVRVQRGEPEHWLTSSLSPLVAASALPLALHFAIEDMGCGIDPAEEAAVFEPFGQTQAGQQSQEGTGLGLPISRQFVQLLGGDLSFISTPNQGSTFYFTIPVGVVETDEWLPQSRPRRVVKLAEGQPRYRLLVVEDNPENCQFLVQLLELVGFEVRVAANGQEAVDQWQDWAPHLIWMDLRMPIMDGYAATRQIRELEKANGKRRSAKAKRHKRKRDAKGAQSGISAKPATTKILALTASAFEDERTAILAAGCDDFVHKPATEALLLEKIAEHLGVRYVYQDLTESSGSTRNTDSPKRRAEDTLQVMSPDWVAQLRQAARIADEELILVLIDQIPPDQSELANQLKQWVSDLRLDKLIDLTSTQTDEYPNRDTNQSAL